MKLDIFSCCRSVAGYKYDFLCVFEVGDGNVLAYKFGVASLHTPDR